jgi:uncharacterized protein
MPSRAAPIDEVEFPSEGAMLRGLLFSPEPRVDRAPLVVMAHGTSATMVMAADDYAAVFRNAGLAVLLFDHRNFGRSGGEPRQEINPWVQARGYRDAINFAERCAGIDPGRIGLWGCSYSGGEVIVVGAVDPRVRAIVAQCPVCGAEPPRVEPSRAHFQTIEQTLARGDVRGSPETTTGPLPVVSPDPLARPSLLEPIQAFRWFIEYGGRPGSRWLNTATRVVPLTPVPFSPLLCAPFVRAPTLMMVAPEDEMVHANPRIAKHAYSLLACPKEWYEIAGGHFGLLYTPGERFDEASRVQAAFLAKWLAPAG